MPITNGLFGDVPVNQSLEFLGILWQWINEHGKVVLMQLMQATFVLWIFVLVCVHSSLLTWIANYLVTCVHSVLYSVSPCQICAEPVMPYISTYTPALEHNNIDQYRSGCPPLLLTSERSNVLPCASWNWWRNPFHGEEVQPLPSNDLVEPALSISEHGRLLHVD